MGRDQWLRPIKKHFLPFLSSLNFWKGAVYPQSTKIQEQVVQWDNSDENHYALGIATPFSYIAHCGWKNITISPSYRHVHRALPFYIIPLCVEAPLACAESWIGVRCIGNCIYPPKGYPPKLKMAAVWLRIFASIRDARGLKRERKKQGTDVKWWYNQNQVLNYFQVEILTSEHFLYFTYQWPISFTTSLACFAHRIALWKKYPILNRDIDQHHWWPWCVHTKWPPNRYQIFNLFWCWRNMAQIIPHHTLKLYGYKAVEWSDWGSQGQR